ncbi:MAG: L,D-transpeptidase family protein [Acidobacteriaceae bacterium]
MYAPPDKARTLSQPSLHRYAAILLLLVFGCVGRGFSAAGTGYFADPAAVSAQLHEIAAAGKLVDLRYPDFSDYRLHFQNAYEVSNFAPLWLEGGQPSPQALGLIQAFEQAQRKGLDPEEFDASRWPARIAALQTNGGDAKTVATFDAAMTVAAMRYISDLHIGRVSPSHFNFGIDAQEKKYDLPQFLTTNVIHASDLTAVLAGIEPTYAGYQRVEGALQQYEQLAAKGDGPAVPAVQKTVAPGEAYTGSAELEARLQLLGDLPPGVPTTLDEEKYDPSLVDGVKHFQTRHGLAVDGKLDKETIRQMNVPLATRVVQLEDALERWRWLPAKFPQPPVVVNIPEFVLRAFNYDQKVALEMNVVVGKAVRTQTPVFAELMKYIVFRPYWNVPPSIVRGETIPSIVKDRGYIGKKGFEVTDNSGKVITSGTVSDDVLAQLRAGKLMVRQKPGPTNALGLIKFIFPNANNVYLHSTPAPQLFSQDRRDFSHGCVRVEKPAELAAFLLRNQPPWTLAKVQAAMQSGPDNQQVNLVNPVPVLIVYQTAVVAPDDSVHFFEDIYGHDNTLNAVLAKGPPYP